MISEKLFELAFAYKKTKLWKSMWDTEIFAVRLPDGEIGYCSIMGYVGQHIALGLYVGDKGFSSFQIVMKGPGMLSELNYHEFLLSQNCLQCAFEAKDDLAEEEVAAARNYAKAHNITLRGRHAFPHFVRFRPNYLPWFLKEELEQTYLCEALAAAVAVAQRLEEEKCGKADLGILPVTDDSVSIPLLERNQDTFSWSTIALPKVPAIQYPQPRYINDIAAAKLKRLKKDGIWECEVVRFPEPMQDSPDQAPYFPVLLMVVSNTTEQILQPQISEHYDEKPEELVDQFAEMFLQTQVRPAILSLRSERTRVLLEGFCERAGIRIRMCEDLPLLDETIDFLMEHMGVNHGRDATLEEILNMLLQFDDSDLDNLPDEIRQQFAAIIEQENLPDELVDQLTNRLRMDGSRQKTTKYNWIGPRQSYIIRVSCGQDCYRHIQISDRNTLTDLHEMIQYAFSFDDDHAYAFFMDNKLWSNWNAYYAPFAAEGERNTDDCRLCELELTAGQPFKYLFDFGDEWVFQCKVLQVLDEMTEVPAIVCTKGDPPEQY